MACSQKGTPSINKLFCSETCSEKLEIPVSFKKSVRILPNEVLLRNGHRKIWKMDIVKTEDGLYFKNDWAKFVEDNFITNGDRLIFNYDGYGVFDFIVLDQSGCEKLVVLGARNEAIRVMNENDVVVLDGDKDEEEVKAIEPKRMRNNADSSPFRVGGSKNGDGADAGEGSSSQKNKNVHDQFGANTNPHFVTEVGKNKRTALLIPGDLIKNHKLELPSVLTMRDSRGREWSGEISKWKDGRAWLKGPGWRSLCQENKIEEGVECRCEFMCPGTSSMFLQISVVSREATKNN